MKPTILFIFTVLLSPIFAQKAPSVSEKHMGISLGSSYLSGLGTISVGPSLFYYSNQHKFELGFQYHPANVKFQHKYGGEFLYTYYMDGIDKRFNPFLISSLTVTRNNRFNTMWSGDYRRKEVNAAVLVGLGCQIKLSDKAFIGGSISMGTSTEVVDAVNDNYSYPMFLHYNFERAARINIGYRL